MYRSAILRKRLQQCSLNHSAVISQGSLESHSAVHHYCYGLFPMSWKQLHGCGKIIPKRKDGLEEKLPKIKPLQRLHPPWYISRYALHSSTSDFAGHNKWSKVKYIKGPKDHERSMITSKVVSQMRVIMKEGGTNPDANPELANMILFARSKGIPKNTIENFIKNAAKSKDKGGSQHVCEIQGPKGSALIVEYFTDNKKRSRDQLLLIVKKHGCTVGAPGSVMHTFKRKGVLELREEDEPLTLDQAMELAIEVGGEDVVEEEEEDEGGRPIFKILCDQADFRDVRDALRNTRYSSGLESIEYLPETMVTLADTDLDKLGSLITKLEEHPEVLKVYHNITDGR
ncbi:putative translational activator of cytochrome c oxidase 1 [Apostichopus japonicus]|uniref:Putative translational activator of cytochrome c oxidase 1 n=1 Tax=Stichopus japonicus TaxID=307972 RepID=A0A2G8LQE1_STIJA|nr:putative translational activator of cytochrome c oxidase 1 [Apostichopus japonicus]